MEAQRRRALPISLYQRRPPKDIPSRGEFAHQYLLMQRLRSTAPHVVLARC